MIDLARLIRNIFSSDMDRRLRALKILSKWIMGDYRLTWHQMDWWYDQDFNEYLRRFDEIEGFNTHRKWSLWQLLRLTGGVEGDTAECGVFEAASSWLICSGNRQLSAEARKHHLFDSFEGLSEPIAEDGTYWDKGSLAAGEEIVTRNLSPFANDIVFHKGWIPDRFADVNDRTFSFVHVDVDLYQPTRDSIQFFYGRLNDGAIFLCDDYGCSTCPGATKAVDEFLADKPEKMLALDGGGGFFIKGTETGRSVSPMEPARKTRMSAREGSEQQALGTG